MAPLRTRLEEVLERVGRWTTASCLVLLAGCSSSEDTVDLEVFTWWRDDSEEAAFEQVSSKLAPHIVLTDPGASSSTRTRARLADNLFADKPPSSFQANLGADLLRWNQVELAAADGGEQPSVSYLEPLNRWFSDLAAQMEPELVEHLKVGEQLYGIPINIHRLNLLYFNLERATAFKERNGRSFMDLGVLCPEAPTATPPFTLAIGFLDQFMLVQLVFEALLPALHGKEFYEQLFIDAAPQPGWQDRMREVLQCYAYLSRGFVGSDDSTWRDAVELVRKGDADFTVTGDWATGKLADDYPSVVGSVPFPQTNSLFIFTSDTFSLPSGAPEHEETLTFLETVANAEVQQDFSRQKGSIPANVNSDVELVGDFAVQTRYDFEHTSHLLATSGVLPPYYPLKDLGEALKDLARPTQDTSQEDLVEDALEWIEAGQVLITKWKTSNEAVQ